jgi:hypothetical protein
MARQLTTGWGLVVVGLAAGCGTTRLTDTQRTATEQLLVSHAIDQAVSTIDFRTLAGKPVFFDPQYLDGVVDRGYLVSSLRQQLLAAGCLLQEDRTKATYVVEVRSGSVGTNRHALLIGVPQMNVPTFVPGQPSQIPEIPLAKKTDQEGIAKIAVFAYNRTTGQPVWQSGVVQAMSSAKDTWLLGAGPFQNGTIRKSPEFAGEPLPIPHFGPRENQTAPVATVIPLTRAAAWVETPLPRTDATARGTLDATEPGASNRLVLALVTGTGDGSQPTAAPMWPWNQLPSENQSRPAAPGETDSKPKLLPPRTSNAGGQVETEPCKILTSGIAIKPEMQIETEPCRVVDTGTGFKPDK